LTTQAHNCRLTLTTRRHTVRVSLAPPGVGVGHLHSSELYVKCECLGNQNRQHYEIQGGAGRGVVWGGVGGGRTLCHCATVPLCRQYISFLPKYTKCISRALALLTSLDGQLLKVKGQW